MDEIVEMIAQNVTDCSDFPAVNRSHSNRIRS